jgi:hypothetical protein
MCCRGVADVGSPVMVLILPVLMVVQAVEELDSLFAADEDSRTRDFGGTLKVVGMAH